MTAYDFDLVRDRHHTGSLKWDRYVGRDVLPLWVADMDFASPPEVGEALRERIAHGIFGYTRAPRELVKTIVDYFQRRHGVEVDPAWLVWLPGLVPALSMACGCAGESGDEVMTLVPVYPPFLNVYRDSGRRLVTVPLHLGGDGRYGFDLDEVRAAITPRSRVFLFCNPHNPVGRVYTRSEVESLAELCVARGMVFCSDEIHCDLILDESRTPHVSAVSLSSPLRNRSITLMAASKTYNIAGLACAFAVVPDAALRAGFRRAAGGMLAETSPLGFAATTAAYAHGEPWRQALLAYLRGNLRRIEEFVAARAPQLAMARAEATYLAWLDVRQLNLTDPMAHFERNGLGLSPGADFGAPGFMRLNFGTPRAILDEAIRRLELATAVA